MTEAQTPLLPPPPLARWVVAAIFTAGAVVGMVLLHCADPPRPYTAHACQSLVWSSWASEQDVLSPSKPILVSSARQLVRDIRRCAGLSTTFIDDTDADPFGIDHHSTTPPADGGIYRSH